MLRRGGRACRAGMLAGGWVAHDRVCRSRLGEQEALLGAIGDAEAPPFAEVQAIVAARCVSCHAARPTQEGFAAPPKGVVMETPRQIRRWAASMRQQVQTEAMLPGNLTEITGEERARLLAWVAAGAPAE